jgi:hypothetical protein
MEDIPTTEFVLKQAEIGTGNGTGNGTGIELEW